VGAEQDGYETILVSSTKRGEAMMHLTDVVEKIMEILNTECERPADELVKLGKTLVKVGTTLKPLPRHDARQVMLAVKMLVMK
jgi:hypothetical protein